MKFEIDHILVVKKDNLMFLVWEMVDFVVVVVNKWKAIHRKRNKFRAEKNSVINNLDLKYLKNNSATIKLGCLIAW